MALADTANLIVNLSLKGNFARQLTASQRALGSFDARLAKSESRAFRVGQHIGTGIRNLGRLATAGAVAVGSIAAASLKVAGDFEAQLNTINTIARETPAGLSRIGDQIRAIARETGTPLEDLTQGYYDLLSAGIKAADAQKVLAASNTLAIGGLATTAETIDLLTTTINTYGFKASKAATIADVFAKAIERGKVTAADLAGAFSDIGPIAAASGISLEEVAAAFARLTATGVPAAEAATQMRSAIVALTRRTSELKKLEKQTGRNYLAIAGRQGLVKALEIMRKDAAKAGVPLIELLGRVEGLNFTLATTGPNLKNYNADLKAMGKAAGTAAQQMAEREKGLNFQLEKLRALAKDAGITIGSKLLPKITPIFERINKAIQDNQPAIEAFGDAIAGLFTTEGINEGISLLKEVAPVVADSARVTASFVSAAVKAFNSLPAEVKAIAFGALAVNKLTGGIVTTLAGGVFSQFFARGASPANPMWVATVGGGLPGAPIPGVPGGTPKPPGVVTPTIGAAVAISVNDLKEAQSIYFGKLHGDLGTINQSIKASPDRLEEAISRRAAAAAAALLEQRHGEQGIEPARIHSRVPVPNRLPQAVEKGARDTRIAVDKVPPTITAGAASIVAANAETKRETSRGVVATEAVRNATATGASRIVGATSSGTNRIVAAIYAARPIVNVTNVQRTTTIQNRYGPGNGSYGGGQAEGGR